MTRSEPALRLFGGDFTVRASHQPEALQHLVECAGALHANVPPRTAAVIALTVAGFTGDAYGHAWYERLAVESGMSLAEAHGVPTRGPDGTALLSDEERAAAALARCLLDGAGRGCDAALLRLTRLVGEPTAVGCLMLTTLQIARATMANAWRLAPAPDQ